MTRRKPAPPAAPRPELMALLHAAKEQLDEAPRFVLADWLEEHGDEHDLARAEFVRLQCQSARLPSDSAEARSLVEREKLLLRKHGAAWLGPLPAVAGPMALDVRRFSRGLLHVAEAGQRLAGQAGLALEQTEAHTWVDRWTVHSISERLLSKLAETSLLGGLTTLSFRCCALRGEGARTLSSAALDCLSTLDLHHCWIGDDGATALARCRSARRLRSLDLSQDLIGAAGIRKLGAWPGLATVKRLDLSANAFYEPGALALARWPALPNLRALNVSNCFIGDKGAEALAASPLVASLTELNLVFNKIGDAGAMALVGSPHLTALQGLHLGYERRISHAAWTALRERFGQAVTGRGEDE